MICHDILITENDRRRLGTMLLDPRVSRAEHPERLHALEAELERAYGVDPAELPHDVVTMNSTVEIRDLKSGETETYTLVYPERADINANCISILAPIGTAILGCRVGDVVRVKTPSGVRRIRVEEIHFQPERAGEHHL
ncbi:MAG TPA: nucleoside diphosphate kinase regulator [Sedimentisphaerales bacterium]|nr:nucleoside diphosphate kinase regulator [Sedimentisphaerales bacterium]